MRVVCGIIVFVVICVQSKAQITLPDSITQKLKEIKRDSSFVLQLNKIATTNLDSNPTLSRNLAMYSGDIAKKIGFTRGYARSLTVVGNSYWYEGVYEFAQNYYLLAARQYQSIHDSVGLGYVYNNMGEVNKKLGDNENALRYLTKSVALREGDSTIALTLSNIAEFHIMNNNYDEATKYVDQSMEVAQRFNDVRSLNYNYLMLAKITLAKKSLKEALPYFNNAIEGWKRSGETRSLIQGYLELTKAFRQAGKFEQSRQYLLLARQLERRLNLPDLRARTYFELAKLDSSMGDFHAALIHLEKHNNLKDSIFNIAKAEQVARVQAVYDRERVDRENEQLRADRTLREQRFQSRENLLIAITGGLVLAAILVTILLFQRKRILYKNKLLKAKNDEINSQKQSIELQAIELRKLNEKLQELNKTLESRIEERSKLLLAQNKKLDQYSFVNAHQLRAPVASILGLIQIIGQVNPEERDVILQHLKTCGEQLDAVIQEISRNLASED